MKCCPFCGSDSEVIEFRGVFWGRCKDTKECGVETGVKDSEEKAIVAWNTRDTTTYGDNWYGG